MSYLGFGIQDPRGLRKPRRPFKPVFEQLYNGEHPTKDTDQTNPEQSWFSKNEHLFAEQKMFDALKSRIHLITAFAFMATTIIALV